MATSQDDYKQSVSVKHTSKSGLRVKINVNRIDCTYEHNDADSWRKQVENYCEYLCSLYYVRPTTLINTK